MAFGACSHIILRVKAESLVKWKLLVSVDFGFEKRMLEPA